VSAGRRAVSSIESFSMKNQTIIDFDDNEPIYDAHAALVAIYRNPRLPIRQRLAAAAEAIGYEKLPVGDAQPN
jgi:hypothetical protein